jgi:hypothetical protein
MEFLCSFEGILKKFMMKFDHLFWVEFVGGEKKSGSLKIGKSLLLEAIKG